MSQPPPSSRLRRLTEVPPPLLPELPRPKRIPAAASQSVLSSFFHPIDTPSQSEKSSVYGDGRQKRRASLPYSPHHSRGSTGDMLSLSMATNEIEPTIKSDRTMYIENNEHDQQYQNSSQSNLINIQEDVITKSSASYTPSRILKDSALEPVATSTLVTLPTNSNTESRVDATEFIPSTLEMPLCVQTTHISTEGYEQGISTQSPTLSSSMCSSFPESNDIVFNSMDQHSPLVSSPAPSVKRSGSSTSSRSRKQNDKRKKAIQTASSETIGESPASSQHISSTALFEANMADIERYVDQDLYGYNNLSY
ncbi:hypothetical protein BGX27_002447 [Mortierella sp. AM989]|nr:hypothetical protein BGX27_002447 [Mortierella sp. AM989]